MPPIKQSFRSNPLICFSAFIVEVLALMSENLTIIMVAPLSLKKKRWISSGSICRGTLTSSISLVHRTDSTPGTWAISSFIAIRSAVVMCSTVIIAVLAMLKSSSRYRSPTMESSSGGKYVRIS